MKEILVVILLAMFMNGYLSILDVFFNGTSIMYPMFIAIILFWFPNMNKAEIIFKSHTYYSSIDKISDTNPLYKRGFFRKHASGKAFIADLKGFWFCQIVSILPIILSFVYAGFKKGKLYENKMVEEVLAVILVLLIVIRMVFGAFMYGVIQRIIDILKIQMEYGCHLAI